MTFGADDMGVFYDPDVFGIRCARRRVAEDDLPFVAIFGTVDDLALDGYAVSAEHGLRYATEDIELGAGDRVIVGCDVDDAGSVIVVGGTAQGGTEYRVRAEPRRLNDGAESAALLSSFPS